MVKNINDPERFVRFVGGTVVTSLAFWGPPKLLVLVRDYSYVNGFCGDLSSVYFFRNKYESTEKNSLNLFFIIQDKVRVFEPLPFKE